MKRVHAGSACLKRITPWCLLSIRLLMVPAMFVFRDRLTDRQILWFYIIAFITDYYDGASARFFGTATPALRKSDSAADTVFHVAVAWLIFRHHPDLFRQISNALALFLTTAVIWYGLDAIRWRRVAGFHAYSAKLFSTLLLIWMVLYLDGVHTGNLLPVILIYGAFSNVEGIVISSLLARDCCDVPTIYHALKMSRRDRKVFHLDLSQDSPVNLSLQCAHSPAPAATHSFSTTVSACNASTKLAGAPAAKQSLM